MAIHSISLWAYLEAQYADILSAHFTDSFKDVGLNP